jgi:hypothetical protein
VTPAGKVHIMSAPIVPSSGRPSLFTVTSGLDLLDEWSAHATQSQKNIVNRIIFAVADKNVFTEYCIVDDIENHMEFFVLAKNDLAVKIRIEGFDSFGILYIGSSCAAPGLDPAWPASITPAPDSLPAGGTQEDARQHP